MYSGATTNVASSSNWSGLALTGSGIEGATGAWRVPAVRASSSPLYSSSWVGVDGLGNSDLIQTGTSQDTTDGYYAWLEILPAPAAVIVQRDGSPAPVTPGDEILAYVAEASAGVWTIYIQDETQRWYFQQNFDYSGPGKSAEWIEEAPTIDGLQSYPADFGTIPFSKTELYGDFGKGLGWFSTDMSASNEVAMVNQGGTQILAVPSAPTPASSNGQSFTDTYVTAPGTPTGIKAAAGPDSASLSWHAPASNGGTSIASYYVQESKSGSLLHTFAVTRTSTTISGLTSGQVYSFRIATHSAGNWTSSYSPSIYVRPTTPPPPEGYWLAASDGAVLPAGKAAPFGGVHVSGTDAITGIAATPSGNGYWLVAANGAVYQKGGAHFAGDLPDDHVRVDDIVAIAPTGDGRGYWLIGRDGGEFAFGDARYHGSLPGVHVHVHDIVGMVATSNGGGYWLVGADGGIFAFGNATFKGSLPGLHVHTDDIRAMIASPTREGYVLVGADGGTFVFGSGVHFYGSLPGKGVHVRDIVGLALTPGALGYWLAGANGAVYPFGNAETFRAPAGLGNDLPIVAIAGM